MSSTKTPPRTESTANPHLASLVSHSSTSTPHKTSKDDLGRGRKTMDPQLRHDLHNRFLNTTVQSYVAEILQVNSKVFDERKSKDWNSVKNELQDEIEQYLSATKEINLYQPFLAIAEKILSKAEAILGEKLDFPFDLQYQNQSSRRVDSDLTEAGVRSPDVVSVILDPSNSKGKESNLPKNANWNRVCLIAEFKKDKKEILKTPDEFTPASNASQKLSVPKGSSKHSTSEYLIAKSSQKSSQTQKESRAQSNSEAVSNTEHSLGKRKSTSALSSESKRIKSETTDVDWATQNITLSPEEQITSYALELFTNTGLRSHVLGMLVIGSKMNLCFFDREGCVKTEAFDFIEEFDRFAVILICLHLLDAHQWGFHAFLDIPRGVIPHFGTDNTSLTMKVGEISVQLTGLRYQQYGLVGRGTAVFDAVVIEGPESLINKEVVVKSSSQVTTRLREDSIIQIAHERLSKSKFKKYTENIPEVYASSEGPKLSTLRSKILSDDADYEDRIIRNIIFPRYDSITSLETLKLFMIVFRNIFHCHHALFICGILHRDISLKNIMCYRFNGRVIGILLDFDLSIFVTEDGKATDPSSKFRTGTLAYMSIDLLQGSPGPHLYRYDLESFFYVLIYYGCHWEGGGVMEKARLSMWTTPSRIRMVQAKRSFLLSPDNPLNITSFFSPLSKIWIYRIWGLLFDGYMTKGKLALETLREDGTSTGLVKKFQQPDIADGHTEEDISNILTLYGNVTYDRFAEIIGPDSQ